MSDRVLKVTASDADGQRIQRLNWAMGDVDRARRIAGLPFPFGSDILHVHDERDTLVVHWASPECMVLYGRFLLDAWREHGNLKAEFVLPDGTRLTLSTSMQSPDRANPQSKGARAIDPTAFRH